VGSLIAGVVADVALVLVVSSLSSRARRCRSSRSSPRSPSLSSCSAAIVRERGIAGSIAGVTATAAAGIRDVAAWLALAAALAGTAPGPGRQWPVTLLLTICLIAVMLLAVQPALRWWIHRRAPVRNQLLVTMVNIGALDGRAVIVLALVCARAVALSARGSIASWS
jgi:Kef-type K+ transport system membrane component KefB